MTTLVPYNSGLDWGTVPSQSEIPNVSGAVIQSPDVRVGARVYVPGHGAYICDDPTPGAASWSPFGTSGADLPYTPIWTEADFPEASGGVITLAASTVYQINAAVTLTAGHRIVLPAGSSIIGTTAVVSKIIGDYDGSLISQSGTTGTSRIQSVAIVNNSTGASSRALEQTAAGSTLLLLFPTLQAYKQAIYNSASGSMFGFLAAFVTLDGGSVVDIEAGGSVSFLQCSTYAVAASSNHFRLRSGAVLSVFGIQNHGWLVTAASQVGVLDEGATITTRARLVGIVATGAGVGTFAPNSGWTAGTPRWSVSDVYQVQDSAAVGASDITSTITVTVSAALTYYDVSDGTSVWELDSDTERFQLRATTGVQTGEIEYTGTRPRRGIITGSVAVRRASGATAIGVRVSTYIDNVLHVGSVASADVTNRTTQIAIAPSLHNFSDTPTRVRLVIMNEDDTTDLVIERASLAIVCATVS